MPISLTNNAAVDVVTGLALMYLTLSLSCAFINELAATFFQLRAKTLAHAMEEIIDIPQLRADFYQHGLISGSKAGNSLPHVSYIHSRNFALGLLACLCRDTAVPSYEGIAEAVHKLPDSTIRDIVRVNMVTADGNLITLHDNIACWFEHAMHRLSGVYNRRMKVISLLAGICIAIAVNADSINVSEALWHDATLRAELLSSIRSITPDMDFRQAEEAIRPLPLGWHFPFSGHGLPFWLLKATGLMMTGIALSLGAPFWFDLLSRFISLRGTGKRPDCYLLKSSLAN